MAVIAVRFETFDEFCEEVISESLVDGEVVRAQVEQHPVNDGLSTLHLRCGFLSENQLRETVVYVGDVLKGEEADLTDAKELLSRLKDVCEDRSLSIRKGRFEIVVAE